LQQLPAPNKLAKNNSPLAPDSRHRHGLQLRKPVKLIDSAA
jgi:hypothetical protein